MSSLTILMRKIIRDWARLFLTFIIMRITH